MTGRSSLMKLAVAVRQMADLYDDGYFDEMADDIAATAIAPDHLYIAKVAHYVMSKNTDLPEFWRKNYDYGEVWPGVLDAYRDGKVQTIVDYVRQKQKAKRRLRKKANIAPAASSVNYWSNLLDGSESPAVEQYIAYVRQSKCGNAL